MGEVAVRQPAHASATHFMRLLRQEVLEMLSRHCSLHCASIRLLLLRNDPTTPIGLSPTTTQSPNDDAHRRPARVYHSNKVS